MRLRTFAIAASVVAAFVAIPANAQGPQKSFDVRDVPPTNTSADQRYRLPALVEPEPDEYQALSATFRKELDGATLEYRPGIVGIPKRNDRDLSHHMETEEKWGKKMAVGGRVSLNF
jgi:hypothetical protein